jgi:predicted amidophosphoribosyltransferase
MPLITAARGAARALVDLVLPADCAGCGRPEPPWCARCAAALGPPAVPHLPGGPPALAAGRYAGPLRTALLRYKERGRRDLARPLAALLAGPLHELAPPRPPTTTWLLPAPSRPAAARARGGDHVLRLCQALSAQRADLRVAHSLRLDRGVRDSVGLDAAARAANLRGRIRVRADRLPPPGDRSLIVDDVVTTGATLRGCRCALAGAGIAVRAALVLCDATAPG